MVDPSIGILIFIRNLSSLEVLFIGDQCQSLPIVQKMISSAVFESTLFVSMPGAIFCIVSMSKTVIARLRSFDNWVSSGGGQNLELFAAPERVICLATNTRFLSPPEKSLFSDVLPCSSKLTFFGKFNRLLLSGRDSD